MNWSCESGDVGGVMVVEVVMVMGWWWWRLSGVGIVVMTPKLQQVKIFKTTENSILGKNLRLSMLQL